MTTVPRLRLDLHIEGGPYIMIENHRWGPDIGPRFSEVAAVRLEYLGVAHAIVELWNTWAKATERIRS